MKVFRLLVLSIMLSGTSASSADSSQNAFPKVGETYRIQTSSPLVETPYENRVTVLEVGQGGWVRVTYEKMGRGADGSVGRQKHEMWVNLAHVTSAVAAGEDR